MDIFFVHFSLSQKSLGKKNQLISKISIFKFKVTFSYKKMPQLRSYYDLINLNNII